MKKDPRLSHKMGQNDDCWVALSMLLMRLPLLLLRISKLMMMVTGEELEDTVRCCPWSCSYTAADYEKMMMGWRWKCGRCLCHWDLFCCCLYWLMMIISLCENWFSRFKVIIHFQMTLQFNHDDQFFLVKT